MAEPIQSDGTTSQEGGAAEPVSQGQQVDYKTQYESTQKELSNAQAKAEKYDQVADWWARHPEVAPVLDNYDTDPAARKLIESYQTGGDPTESDSDGDPVAVDPKIKALEEKIALQQEQITFLNKDNALGKIQKTRENFTKEKGYPFSFDDAKDDVQGILKSGEATTTEAAYYQALGRKWLDLKKKQEGEVLDWKRRASMPRNQTPASLPFQSSDEKPKSFLELMDHFEEQRSRS